jgi:hypothetical protein
MVLTLDDIRSSPTDKALFDKLGAELERRMPPHLYDDLDAYVAALDELSPGLRAMAATHQLDVSMALDDLGWHFANWHHQAYCEETSRGLRELGADEAAQIFDKAYQIVLPHWDAISDMLAVDFSVFSEWYHDSELAESLGPMNRGLEIIANKSPEYGLMTYWLAYARRFPERVILR